VLNHVGRTSGRAYATPLVTRRVDDGFVIPLPFGEGTQWVRNLIAAGAGTIRWDGRDFEIVRPRIVELEEVPGAFGGLSRAVIRRANARFVRVDDTGDAGQHLAGQGRSD
jgi:deazaflavin-dependent oxidoreductase (nitroreductase family)